MHPRKVFEVMGNLNKLEDIDVVILCGGQGTRLRSVANGHPKAMVNIAGMPFIDILIAGLGKWGFKRFILCVGYLREEIIGHFKHEPQWSIEFSEETIPLGTGGALRNAHSMIKSETFLVLNGDTICDINYSLFYDYHVSNDGILSMALAECRQVSDFGSVRIDDAGRIKNFIEKGAGSGDGLVNAGVYLMKKDIFDYMHESYSFSLEHDLFQGIIDIPCYGFVTSGELIDIGTPQRYMMATRLFMERSGKI